MPGVPEAAYSPARRCHLLLLVNQEVPILRIAPPYTPSRLLNDPFHEQRNGAERGDTPSLVSFVVRIPGLYGRPTSMEESSARVGIGIISRSFSKRWSASVGWRPCTACHGPMRRRRARHRAPVFRLVEYGLHLRLRHCTAPSAPTEVAVIDWPAAKCKC